MFPRFRLSYLNMTNIIKKRAASTKVVPEGPVKGNPIYAENAVFYKYKPEWKETIPCYVLAASLTLFGATAMSTYLSFFNVNVKIEPETPEEIQEREEKMAKLEYDFQNKRVNYPVYYLKKYLNDNRDNVSFAIVNTVYISAGSLLLASAFFFYKVPKRIIVKVYKENNELFMQTYKSKKPIALKKDTFAVTLSKSKAFKDQGACILYSYPDEATKKKNGKKLFDIKHMYYFSLDGAEYPNNWTSFQFFIKKE